VEPRKEEEEEEEEARSPENLISFKSLFDVTNQKTAKSNISVKISVLVM
jgi:hypothetical protein